MDFGSCAPEVCDGEEFDFGLSVAEELLVSPAPPLLLGFESVLVEVAVVDVGSLIPPSPSQIHPAISMMVVPDTTMSVPGDKVWPSMMYSEAELAVTTDDHIVMAGGGTPCGLIVVLLEPTTRTV